MISCFLECANVGCASTPVSNTRDKRRDNHLSYLSDYN